MAHVMKATSFNNCFGWLHTATGNNAIIFCNPYGHEALLSHRGMRKLSERLCSQKVSSLRFDYIGTGDSAEGEDDGEQIERWLTSIEQAVQHARQQFGSRKIILCGIRLGAMLAALAAERLQTSSPVDGLIMMSPVVSGKDYLRELKLIQRRWRNTPGNMPNTPEVVIPGTVETFGFRLNARTVENLTQLDLACPSRKLAPVPVLIMDPDGTPLPKVASTMRAMEARGGQVERVDFQDQSVYLGDRLNAAQPDGSFASIHHWLETYFPESTSTDAVRHAVQARIDVQIPGIIGAVRAQPRIEIRGEHYVEVPVRFGNGRLVGIYCQPLWSGDPDMTPTSNSAPMGAVTPANAHSRLSVAGADAAATDADDPSGAFTLDSPDPQTAVLFPNTGGNYHIGDARMWVIQARRLARQGVASLRMDVTGLGDSVDDVDRSTASGLHSSSAWEDCSTGIDWLSAKGHSKPVIVGICSGAFMAFNTAVLNPRVAGVVVINQRIFTYEEKRHGPGGSLFLEPTHVYRDSLRSLEKWKRAWREKGKLKMILSVVTLRMLERARQTIAPAIDLFKPEPTIESGKLSVRAMTRILAKRGVSVRAIFGAMDGGIEEFEIYFGKGFSRLKRFPLIQISIESTMDHALFLYPGRERMMTLVDEYIRDQVSNFFPPALASTPPKADAVQRTENVVDTTREPGNDIMHNALQKA